MWPSTILLQNTVSVWDIVLHEYVSYMKGTTIFANTLFKYTLAFTLRLKTTRRVLLFLVIPPHTCMDPTVTSYCLFPLLSESILSRIWFTIICWTWRWVVTCGSGCPGIGRSFTLFVWWTRCSRRVTVDTLQPNLLQCFVWFNPPISIPSGLFLSFSESRGMIVPKLIQHQLNFFFTTLICL